MARWRWFSRRKQQPPIGHGVIGPATVYASQSGAYALGAAPAENPAWNAPTVPDGRPLMTLGQEHRSARAIRHLSR